MESNTLTILGTLIVAIISGLLAYSSSLSTKEKEVKLTVYEKLGLDSHALIESLYFNTQWILLTFTNNNNLTREDLIAAGEQQPIDINKLRELRVRIQFFDKQCYERYEKITKTHGELLRKIYGHIIEPGDKLIDPSTPFTAEEIESFIKKLKCLSKEIQETKELITTETSKQYNRAISSSKKFTAIAFAVLIIALVAFFFMSLKENKTEANKEVIVLICK
ncbi:hypothetical protein ACK6VG_22340 [Citrobacter braakii]|uniref:hypothetical protein n=1 Tax=Citrobacter braakii TaxID=57706 RepID=UPI001907800D|nr:hypothetical protein [Citrobacter braakii]MBJ8896711.1 hypothetical protein [Citrobacter braakii]